MRYHSLPAGLPPVAGMQLLPAPHATPNIFGLRGPVTGLSTLGWVSAFAHLAAMGALTYHGYKRNDSVGWALVWGILGSIVWPVTVPIAAAQGFGKPKR